MIVSWYTFADASPLVTWKAVLSLEHSMSDCRFAANSSSQCAVGLNALKSASEKKFCVHKYLNEWLTLTVTALNHAVEVRSEVFSRSNSNSACFVYNEANKLDALCKGAG